MTTSAINGKMRRLKICSMGERIGCEKAGDMQPDERKNCQIGCEEAGDMQPDGKMRRLKICSMESELDARRLGICNRMSGRIVELDARRLGICNRMGI
jgi:hypothetical protein